MPISAEDKIYKKIAPTRDTHVNWTLHNPVLPEGVIGAVKDRLWSGSLEFVMGDGISTYTELPKSAVEPSDNIPLPDADIGSAGAETNYARGGHIHPRGPRSKAYVNAESDAAILADTKAGDIIIRKVNNILEILARGDVALSSLLKSVLLDSEGKVPADRLRIVGALASGAIIESGDNANGRYIKWADGTMICTHTYVGKPYCRDYLFNSNKWVLPIANVGTVYISVVGFNAKTNDNQVNNNVYTSIGYHAGETCVWSTGSNSGSHLLANAIRTGGSYGVVSYTAYLVAIGRWK